MAYSGGHQIVSQLRRRRLGVIHLVFFTVAASAPLTALGGGVTTAFAVTGVPGVPLAFLILAMTLAVFASGYAAMSRFVANAGAFYSYLAQGLGRVAGVSGAFVALVAYNAIQIGLYGLFGATMADFAASAFGLDLSWWVWGLVALALVGALGVLRVDLNARILAVLLVLEVVAVVLYDVVALANPAGGTLSSAGFLPSELFVPGVGAVLAFAVACFIGFESSAIYSEECRDPQRTVGRATFVAVIFTGVFYALSAWAMVLNVGPGDLQAQAGENGPGLVFGPLAQYYSPVVADVANVLFLTSVFAALLSFHNGVARYFFALGRERVLPDVLDTVGTRSGGPVAGSLLQTVIAAVVVIIFAMSGGDPVIDLFTWGSGVAALGVVLLMAGTSAAVVGFFRNNPQAPASTWQRLVAPVLASVLLAAMVVILIANFDSVLVVDPTSPLRWILPALVLVSAAAGIAWALFLRSSRPSVYAGIGHLVLAPVDDEPRLDLPPVSPASRRR
jgi:amino acid transporter